MFKNFLKIAARNLWKHKGFSFINIAGLALGITSCLLILLYVSDEWKHDGFHEKGGDLYRITTLESNKGKERMLANAYYPLQPVLEAALPENSKVVRYFPKSVSIKNSASNEITQAEQFFFADSLFFNLFSFDFIQGNATNALAAANSVVITESVAEKHFGKENPIGKLFIIEEKADFFVSGVIKNPPINSSLQFEYVAPMSGTTALFGQNYFHPVGAWFHPSIYTFAYVPNKAYVANWEAQSPIWEKDALAEMVKNRYDFQFQPIEAMHFQALENDLAPAIQSSFLWILLAIAFLILGIASINYINLALSRLIKRFPEIGMRKVLGAENRNILQQMSVEALLYVGISLALAIGLAQFSMPAFNQLTDKQLSLWNGEHNLVWAIILGIVLLITFLIALFPYFGLIRYEIIGILKGKLTTKNKSASAFSLKSSLVVFQFIAAIGLIIATLVIQNQLNFLTEKDLGIHTEQIMVVPIRDESVQKNFNAVKNNLLAQSGVKAVSAISNFPWENGFYDFPTKITGEGLNEDISTPTLLVDADFFNTMGIQMHEGRSFSKAFGSDEEAAFVLNQAAIRKFNIAKKEDMRISMSHIASDGPKEGGIIGVTKDFHLRSLHNPIDPLIMTVSPETYYLDNFVIRLETANLSTSIASLSENWSKVVPNRPFEYFFLDDAFEKLYRKESRMSAIFQFFTFLALFIAFLGLLALSALAAQQRTKEIGIRKVLGASVGSLVQLLAKDFIKLVLIALVLVSPIAWYFMNKWLGNFAYHVDIRWSVFAIAGLSTIIVAFLTVGFQAFKAAVINPVDSLKNE